MEGIQNLAPHQQQAFMKELEQAQMKESLQMYNNLVTRCFDICVTGFRSKTLEKGEITCVNNCSDRFIKMTQRVGLRFAEHQALQQQKLAEGGAK